MHGGRVVPQQNAILLDRLDDFPGLPVFLGGGSVQTDVDLADKRHLRELLDDVLHGGGREIGKQGGNDNADGNPARKPLQALLHAPEVFILQARKGRHDILMKISHRWSR